MTSTANVETKRRYIRGTPEQRFRARISERKNGCWEYDGYREPKGYGKFGVSPRESVLAHRFAYELFVGEIPDGLFVCHRCDNPPCVNPDHLFLGTLADNNRDMWGKGRGRIPHGRGDEANNVRLTTSQVIEIRRRYKPRVVTQRMLAEEFGVSTHAIGAIISRRNWRHLDHPTIESEVTK